MSGWHGGVVVVRALAPRDRRARRRSVDVPANQRPWPAHRRWAGRPVGPVVGTAASANRPWRVADHILGARLPPCLRHRNCLSRGGHATLPTPNGPSSATTSSIARSPSAPATVHMGLPASTSTPASAARCSVSTRPRCHACYRSRPTPRTAPPTRRARGDGAIALGW